MTGNAARNKAYEQDLHRLVHRSANIMSRPDGFHIEVPCDACRKPVDAFHMRSKLPPEVIRKKMLNAGWTLNGGKHAECPNHIALVTISDPEPKEEPMPEFLHATKVDGPAPAAPTMTPSERTKVAKREALQWLDEAFSIERGQYRAGVSDASIAKETGLSVDAVKALREDFYGPLKMPTELEDATALLKEVNRAIEQAQIAFEESHLALVETMKNISSRITALKHKNGWAE